LSLADLRGSRAARGLFWAAALFAFVMAILPHPPNIPLHPSDKIQHVTAFAVLAALGAWAYPSARLRALALRLSLFGALIEIVQAIPVLHRDSDVVDWIADTLACSLVLLLIWWRWRRHESAAASALRPAARAPISRGDLTRDEHDPV
jgi:VanZ family protein